MGMRPFGLVIIDPPYGVTDEEWDKNSFCSGVAADSIFSILEIVLCPKPENSASSLRVSTYSIAFDNVVEIFSCPRPYCFPTSTLLLPLSTVLRSKIIYHSDIALNSDAQTDSE